MPADSRSVVPLLLQSLTASLRAATGELSTVVPTIHVDLVETHISWLLLASDFVYKVKKPLKLPFLDFSTLDKRRECCLAEVRLNSRFAPDIYLDVVAIHGTPRDPHWVLPHCPGPTGAATPWAPPA